MNERLLIFLTIIFLAAGCNQQVQTQKNKFKGEIVVTDTIKDPERTNRNLKEIDIFIFVIQADVYCLTNKHRKPFLTDIYTMIYAIRAKALVTLN
jgi:hypothetical protein